MGNTSHSRPTPKFSFALAMVGWHRKRCCCYSACEPCFTLLKICVLKLVFSQQFFQRVEPLAVVSRFFSEYPQVFLIFFFSLSFSIFFFAFFRMVFPKIHRRFQFRDQTTSTLGRAISRELQSVMQFSVLAFTRFIPDHRSVFLRFAAPPETNCV